MGKLISWVYMRLALPSHQIPSEKDGHLGVSSGTTVDSDSQGYPELAF